MRWIWRFGALALAAGVLLWAGNCRIDPEPMTQLQYYEAATTFEGGRFTEFPKPCDVSVPACDRTLLDLGVAYVRGARKVAVKAGSFDRETRRIAILSDYLRVQAGLPGPLRKQFLHTLRHEYGHAFTDDMLRIKYAKGGTAEQPYLAFQDGETLEPQVFAPTIAVVVEEYKAVRREVYGMPYYTSAFNEYMAESYARFVEGSYVPPETRKFLAAQATAHSGAAR